MLTNDSVFAMGYHSGDGVLKLAKFEELVREQEHKMGGFKHVCGLGS